MYIDVDWAGSDVHKPNVRQMNVNHITHRGESELWGTHTIEGFFDLLAALCIPLR